MKETLHYVSPSQNLTLDVYRHTLFVSINGPLVNDSIDEVVKKYYECIHLLNANYEFWGQIISLNDDLIVTREISEMLLSGDFDVDTHKRKCIGVTVMKGVKHDSASALITYLPNIPYEVFDTIPEAMVWIDSFMNWFAVKHHL